MIAPKSDSGENQVGSAGTGQVTGRPAAGLGSEGSNHVSCSPSAASLHPSRDLPVQ